MISLGMSDHPEHVLEHEIDHLKARFGEWEQPPGACFGAWEWPPGGWEWPPGAWEWPPRACVSESQSGSFLPSNKNPRTQAMGNTHQLGFLYTGFLLPLGCLLQRVSSLNRVSSVSKGEFWFFSFIFFFFCRTDLSHRGRPKKWKRIHEAATN